MFDKRLLKEALKLKHYVVLMILLGIGTGLLAVSQAYALSLSINLVFLENETLRQVTGVLIALLLIIALRAAFVWVVEYFTRRGAGIIKLDFTGRLLDGIQAKGPIALKGEKTGELLSVFSEGLTDLEIYFSEYIPQISLSMLTPVVILAFVFPVDWISGLILAGTSVLIPVFMLLIGKWGQELTQQRWEKLSVMSAHFLEALRGLETLKLFGRSRSQVNVIRRISDDFRKTTMEVLRVSFLSALVLELASTVSTAVVAVSLGLRLLYGQIQFQEAFFLILLAPEFYLPLRLLGQKFHAGMGGKAAADRIYSIIGNNLDLDKKNGLVNEMKDNSVDAADSVHEKESIELDKAFQGKPGVDLTFENVSFSYEGESKNAVHELSFHVEAGTRAVFSGPSGAGKSTVISLVLRFIQPSSGQILVNGRDLAGLPMQMWRKYISYIPQNPYLFYGTIYENILIGRQGASQEEVIKAAAAACADVFISKLPKGYETFIGEEGVMLSGGQWQLIALARAFLKDAPLVIFDEVTSSLDTINEADVKMAIQKLGRNRTVLLISHREALLEEGDRILLLKEGKLALDCTKSELPEIRISLEGKEILGGHNI